MKFILSLIAMIAISGFAATSSSRCSLEYSMKPLCYHKRDTAHLNIALVYYGASMKIEDLDRIAPKLQSRFLQANGNAISLNILDKRVMPFKHKLPIDFKVENVTDPKRLHRIWYYENLGPNVMTEIYNEYKKLIEKKTLGELDAIIAITGAQFNGLGFANGRVSVTEYPQEIAWGLPGGGRVNYASDYRIIDELIHELGHNMFLGHTSTQCQKAGMTLEQRRQCCKQSENRNDVLSYCRDRNRVDESFMHGFESCNRDMISKKVVPAILRGGNWRISNRTRCR